MGGITGATSGKFVLMAATLLLHGRVDNMRTTIAIVPGAPQSVISPTLAHRLKPGRPVKVGIGAEYLDAPIASVDPEPAPGADLRIGQDILAGNPIEIDFPHHQLRLLLAGEALRRERGMVAIPVAHRSDGMLTVSLTLDGGAPTQALLDLARPSGVAVPTVGVKTVTLGPIVLKTVETAVAAVPSIGLGAFTGARVIFDLGHDRIWVAA